MAGILRGEIYWADLNPVRGHGQAGLRPVVILSNDLFNRHSGTVIAMAITSQQQRVGLPLALQLDGASLPRASWVKISQVRTISVERLGKRMGEVGPEQMSQLTNSLVELIT